MVTAAGYAPTRVGKRNKYRVAFSHSGEQAVFVKRPNAAEWEEASAAFQDSLLFFGEDDVRERVAKGGGSWVSYA